MKLTALLSLVLGLVLTLVAAPNAVAASKGKIGTAGCGLGYMFFGGKDMQILASTTNASSYNQMFGITSGTLECDTGARETAMLTYIQGNKEILEKDIARGQGDSIGALLQITGCTDRETLVGELKGHYSEIFPSADSSAAYITDSIKKTIGSNPELAASCRVRS